MRRDILRRLYDYRCGYCSVHENEAGAFFTEDHFQPKSKGGSNALDNLVYACHACNEYKSDWWEPDSEKRILHPLDDDIFSHLIEVLDHRLIPLTETGRFHIETLRLNRPPLIVYRRAQYLKRLAAQENAEKTEKIAALETEVRLLRQLLGFVEES